MKCARRRNGRGATSGTGSQPKTTPDRFGERPRTHFGRGGSALPPTVLPRSAWDELVEELWLGGKSSVVVPEKLPRLADELSSFGRLDVRRANHLAIRLAFEVRPKIGKGPNVNLSEQGRD